MICNLLLDCPLCANLHVLLLFAQQNWPSRTDIAGMVVIFGSIFGAVLLGYAFMYFDIAAWLRACRRALIIFTNHLPHLPSWTRERTPRCLSAFGLRLPCNEEDLLSVYRRKVKGLHPDRGGDRKKFLKLQADFEQAQKFLQGLNQPSASEG